MTSHYALLKINAEKNHFFENCVLGNEYIFFIIMGLDSLRYSKRMIGW